MCLCVAVYVYIQGTDWWRWMGRLFWGKHTHKSSLWSRTGETPAFAFLRPCPHVSECFQMWLFPKSPNQNSHYVTTNGIPHEKASQVVVCKKKIQFSPVEKVTSLLRFYVSTVASLCDWAATQPHCLTQQMNHFLFSGLPQLVFQKNYRFQPVANAQKTSNSLF